MKMKFALLNTMKETGDEAEIGRVMSRHATLEAAVKKNKEIQPEGNSYIPTTILEITGKTPSTGTIVYRKRFDSGDGLLRVSSEVEDGYAFVEDYEIYQCESNL